MKGHQRHTEFEPIQKCVWMQANVVNYRLCNHNYQCEQCEFDKVMRGLLPEDCPDMSERPGPLTTTVQGESDTIQQRVNNYFIKLFGNCPIYLDRHYCSSQLWCRLENDNCAALGINKFVLKLLHPVQRIVLPLVGNYYHSGQMIALIIRDQQSIPLHSPISGRVIAVNPTFEGNGIALITAEDDYLFKMEGKNLHRNVKQSGDEMMGLKNYLATVNTVKCFLREALVEQTREKIGQTMADGGKCENNLERIIGKAAYLELLHRLF